MSEEGSLLFSRCKSSPSERICICVYCYSQDSSSLLLVFLFHSTISLCLFSLLYVFLLKIHYCSKQIGPLNWHCNATAELGVVALQDGHEVVAAVDGQEAVDEVEAVVVRLPLQILMQTWRSTMQRQCKSTKSLCLGALCVSSTWLILLQICIFT